MDSNNNDTQSVLVQFVDRILEEKGIDGLDTEVVAQMKKDLLDRVEDRINATVLELLPVEKMGELNELLDTGSDQDISTFYQKHIPNFNEELAKTLFSFRTLYLG
ncbi:MAG: hypothetical protein RL641_458 [Candidatus Parcubacteria bacterium]|jgi:flagellar motor switch protein FliG